MPKINENVYSAFLEEMGEENAQIVIEIFIEEIDNYISQIENTKEHDVVFDVMHQLKSTARSVGATELGDMANEMELGARNNDSNNFSKIAKIISEMKMVKKSFQEKLEEL